MTYSSIFYAPDATYLVDRLENVWVKIKDMAYCFSNLRGDLSHHPRKSWHLVDSANGPFREIRLQEDND